MARLKSARQLGLDQRRHLGHVGAPRQLGLERGHDLAHVLRRLGPGRGDGLGDRGFDLGLDSGLRHVGGEYLHLELLGIRQILALRRLDTD